ncbi:MAG: YbjN domain-containing protein [Phycisphaerae bacterium]
MSKEVLDAVSEFLTADDVEHELCQDGTKIHGNIRGETAWFKLIVVVAGEHPILVLIVQDSLIIPERKRPAIAEAMVRANYALPIGRFEMDMSDGDLNFYISMPLGDESITHRQFRALFATALGQSFSYHRAFARVVWGDDLSPAEAVAEIELAD